MPNIGEMIKPTPRWRKRVQIKRTRVARAWERLEAKGFLRCYPRFYISGVIGSVYTHLWAGDRYLAELTPDQARVVRQGTRLYRRYGHV